MKFSMKARLRGLSRSLVLATLFLVLADFASACSVCAVGKEEARGAYYFTTALMSLLPLGMIGGVVYYVAKKSR